MCVNEEEMGLCSCVMCAHVDNVALCCNTVRNVALGLWLVGHPCIALYSAQQTFTYFY